MRVSDRERVAELTADVWGGSDYLAEVFDRWLVDPASWFQAAELDGFLVGVQRLRPLNREVVWFEGLRVAASHQRHGIASAMVREALEMAGRLGFREMRLATGQAHSFFERLGFRRLLSVGLWTATRLEGGEPAAIARPGDLPSLVAQVRADAAFAAYQGLNADIGGSLDLDDEELGRRLAAGNVRVTGGGRALAIVRPSSGGSRLRATYLGGAGAQLEELLLALRFEADADGRAGVGLLLPDEHPQLAAVAALGFGAETWESGDPVRFHIFSHTGA